MSFNRAELLSWIQQPLSSIVDPPITALLHFFIHFLKNFSSIHFENGTTMECVHEID